MLHDPGDRRFLVALAGSLLLHGALIGLTMPMANVAPSTPSAPVLHALLLPPAVEAPAPALLHDTLGEEMPPAGAPLLPLEPQPTQAAIEPARPEKLPPAATPEVQRKLAEDLLYPPEAVAAGIQGEVRVRITLDAAGTVADARIGRSSGHAVLDAAALRAAYALGRLPGAPAGEAVLPVIFRLQ
jgi:protein TonB